MLRSDTIHHKTAWQVPPLDSRAPFLSSDRTAWGVVSSLSINSYILLCFLIVCWLLHAQGSCKIRPCEYSEECPNSRAAFGNLHVQILLLIPQHESLSHFCSSMLCKTPQNKELLNLSRVTNKKEDAFCMLALKAINSLKRKYMFLSNVLKPFSFFKAFFSHSLFLKLPVFFSLSYNFLSFFLLLLLFHFVGQNVVQLEGEELQKLETRL